MAQINFFNSQKEKFTIGLVSFNFLDNNNVFDEYQENHDNNSDIILQVSRIEKIKSLSDKILYTVNSDTKLRIDIKEKLIDLANFIILNNNDFIIVYID